MEQLHGFDLNPAVLRTMHRIRQNRLAVGATAARAGAVSIGDPVDPVGQVDP